MTTVQQIVYTDAPERWWVLAEALGFRAVGEPGPEWAEFSGAGILAVHAALPERRPGACDLQLLVDDLDEAQAALAAFEVERLDMAGVGEMLRVRASSGTAIGVSAGRPAVAGAGVAVQPIWFEEDLAEPRAILEALGLRADIVADGGGWIEFAADRGADRRSEGGSVGLHAGEPRLEASFLTAGDLDELAGRLTAAGFAAAVVDEAYARTVRVADPDGGAEIWINEVQTDLHGYHRAS